MVSRRSPAAHRHAVALAKTAAAAPAPMTAAAAARPRSTEGRGVACCRAVVARLHTRRRIVPLLSLPQLIAQLWPALLRQAALVPFYGRRDGVSCFVPMMAVGIGPPSVRFRAGRPSRAGQPVLAFRDALASCKTLAIQPAPSPINHFALSLRLRTHQSTPGIAYHPSVNRAAARSMGDDYISEKIEQ